MKLSKFKKNQLSVAKLKGLKGGVSGSDDSIETVDGGSSHTTRRSTITCPVAWAEVTQYFYSVYHFGGFGLLFCFRFYG
jgi:hypothetical protein